MAMIGHEGLVKAEAADGPSDRGPTPREQAGSRRGARNLDGSSSPTDCTLDDQRARPHTLTTLTKLGKLYCRGEANGKPLKLCGAPRKNRAVQRKMLLSGGRGRRCWRRLVVSFGQPRGQCGGEMRLFFDSNRRRVLSLRLKDWMGGERMIAGNRGCDSGCRHQGREHPFSQFVVAQAG